MTSSTSNPKPLPAAAATTTARPSIKPLASSADTAATPGAKPAGKPAHVPVSGPVAGRRAVQSPPPPPCRRALVLSLGVAGGIGKSLNADTVAAVSRRAGITTQMIRLESGARRGEFIGDTLVDLDAIGDERQPMVGGVAAHFDPAWDRIEATLEADGVAVMDTGANSHRTVLRLANEVGLSQLVTDKRARTIAMVVLTRDADLVGQSAGLIRDLRESMPEAEIAVVLNERAGAFVADGTREGRAYRDQLMPLLDSCARLTMPFVPARALAAFAACRRSIPEIMEATDAEVMQWSGQPRLRARSCQSYVGAFWLAFAPQIEKVLLRRAAA